MNLAKHDPETEMEMNMTPMIDVVFLLIIFFMIITDMTQQDLEDLTLPMAVHAVEDKPLPGENRPVINIKHDGITIVKSKVIYDEEQFGRDTSKLDLALSGMADRMKKEHLTEGDTCSPLVPGDAILVRADESTPFKFVQTILTTCGQQHIQIWKVQLAVSVPEENQ